MKPLRLTKYTKPDIFLGIQDTTPFARANLVIYRSIITLLKPGYFISLKETLPHSTWQVKHKLGENDYDGYKDKYHHHELPYTSKYGTCRGTGNLS
jgi:hypothetical protein